MQERNYYKRNLPHWQPCGSEYFITFRLAGSLPAKVVAQIKNERELYIKEARNEKGSSGSLPEQQGTGNKAIAGSDRLSDLRAVLWERIFNKYEDLLDRAEQGPNWLSKQSIAKIVKEAIHYRDQKEYDLFAYCLMPNHVHMVFKLLKPDNELNNSTQTPVTDILKSLKWYSALKANQYLGRKGAFWQAESYDRVIRDTEELEQTITYTLNNPVKAGLVEKWQNWPHSYCKPEIFDDFS